MDQKPIKIKFVDFWPGFQPDNNYFFQLLSSVYKVELCENPQVLIFSCYGFEYLNYKCTRIFYSSENKRPDFFACDFAITFDYNDDSRHFRLPLYALYIDLIASVDRLLQIKSRENALKIWKSKTKFCCMVVSNGASKKRLDFFEKLSNYKKVDSGGMILNNIGGPVDDKMAFIKDYRFVIAFENASYPGYTTEKIIEPLLANCLPLYWGNPLISKEFNQACFLNLDKDKTEEEFIEEIISIDTNEEKAIQMLMEPVFNYGKIPEDINKERVLQFFKKIIIASQK